MTLRNSGRPGDAEPFYRRPRTLYEEAIRWRRGSDDRLAWYHSSGQLGRVEVDLTFLLVKQAAFEEAETMAQSAIRRLEVVVKGSHGSIEAEEQLVDAKAAFGHVHLGAGWPSAAAEPSREVTNLLRELHSRSKGDVDLRFKLANAWNNLGLALDATAKTADALAAFAESIALSEKLAAKFKKTPDFAFVLAIGKSQIRRIQ